MGLGDRLEPESARTVPTLTLSRLPSAVGEEGPHDRTPGRLLAADADALVLFIRDVLGGVERRRTIGEAGGGHIELDVGDSVVMVGASPDGGSFPAMLHVYLDDSDAAYQRALALGATPLAEPHDTSFGDHRAAVEDPFGNHWWLSTRRSVP
jgi:PhnB protein